MSEKSAIDKALEIAKSDPQKGHVFYDAFLNAEVFIPVKSEQEGEPCFRPIEADEKFFPLYLNNEKEKVIPVFDSLERLKYWAEEVALDYLKIRAHVFIKMVDPKVQIGLNFGTESNHLFTSDDLDRIRKAIRPVKKPDSKEVH